MLGNYLQQTTSEDDIFRCNFFSWHFKGKKIFVINQHPKKTKLSSAILTLLNGLYRCYQLDKTISKLMVVRYEFIICIQSEIEHSVKNCEYPEL